MIVKEMCLNEFRNNKEEFDRYRLKVKDDEIIICNDGVIVFNDSKKMMEYWRHGRCSIIMYDEIRKIRGEALG